MSGKEFVCFSLKQGQCIFIFRGTDICQVRIRGELLCPPPRKHVNTFILKPPIEKI